MVFAEMVMTKVAVVAGFGFVRMEVGRGVEREVAASWVRGGENEDGRGGGL